MSKSVFGLRLRVMTGLLSGFLMCAILVTYMLFVQSRTERNLTALSHVEHLELAAESIKRRAASYKRNAPRDHASYSRDLLVWQEDFNRDLKEFGKRLNLLRNDYNDSMLSGVFGVLGFGAGDERLETEVRELARRWDLFFAGYKSRLGPNLGNPRLEWGAEYVLEDERRLFQQVDLLVLDFPTLLKREQEDLGVLTSLSLWFVAFLSFLGLIWFQFSIMNRISRTVEGCREVALGGFGYQLEVEREDELGDLVQAFNSLSRRTHLVLSILEAMQQTRDEKESLKVIWEESRGYLDVEWMALVEFDDSDQIIVKNSLPPIVYEPLRRARIPLGESGLESLLHTRQALLINDLEDFARMAANTSRDRFMRLMAERTDLRSLIAVPLVADNDWSGILVYASTEYDHFDEDQVVLLGNLAQMIANGLAKGVAISRNRTGKRRFKPTS